MIRSIILLIKKMENLSAMACQLTYFTGKSVAPIHPKHLIKENKKVSYQKYLKKNMIVLDAGCGSGQHSIQIAKNVKKIIGLDYDQNNLEIAKKTAIEKGIFNIDFNHADLEKKLLLKNKSIDLVILFDILEHLIRRQKFLKEIKRILKMKGYIIVAVPNLDTSWKRFQRKYHVSSYSDPDHKIEYTKESISNELIKAGFKITQIKPVSFDTPLIGLIDLTGGFSLSIYKKLSTWKERMVKLKPEECSGYLVIAK